MAWHDRVTQALRELPVLIGTREEAWQFLGFKHGNGPAKWIGFARSQYIANVHRNFNIALEEIARQIDDTHRTAQRLFRGVMVLEEAESLKAFNRTDRMRNHFSFSHLYTGLDYPGIKGFLQVRPAIEESAEPVSKARVNELREFFRWLWGSKGDQVEPIIQIQKPDPRRPDAVLGNEKALAALRYNGDLHYAFEISRLSSNVLRESRAAARLYLQKARGIVSIGYDGFSTELVRTVGTVATLAVDLCDEMERKHNEVSAVNGRGKQECLVESVLSPAKPIRLHTPYNDVLAILCAHCGLGFWAAQCALANLRSSSRTKRQSPARFQQLPCQIAGTLQDSAVSPATYLKILSDAQPAM